MTEEARIKLRETRSLMMADLESSMLKGKSPEDSIFYYHSSEDRIVLSHALFWVMTKSLKGEVTEEKESPPYPSVLGGRCSLNLTRWVSIR